MWKCWQPNDLNYICGVQMTYNDITGSAGVRILEMIPSLITGIDA